MDTKKTKVMALNNEELIELKSYYLDTQYAKYAINYIEDEYPDIYEELALDKLDPNKDYKVVFDSVVVGMNEFDSLESNMPLEHRNTKGNEGIYQTTLAMYKERTHQIIREAIDQSLEKEIIITELMEFAIKMVPKNNKNYQSEVEEAYRIGKNCYDEGNPIEIAKGEIMVNLG